jgi:Transposase DDE domain group 1
VNFEEGQSVTSFGGMVIFQRLFESIGLRAELGGRCAHLDAKHSHYYRFGTVIQCLVIHLLLGYRKLRDADLYRDDPMVLAAAGLSRLPSVPTVARMLGEMDGAAIAGLREYNRELVLGRLVGERLARVTLDFDGSVLGTGRHAEGSAVGFNKVKRGARSYYPLFCTVAQTGQVLDEHHRPGNVHDSNGAVEFVRRCVIEVQAAMPWAVIEVRMDSAFFSDEIVTELGLLGTEYTISVPFERFTELKGIIEDRVRWSDVPGARPGTAYFEKRWKPGCWSRCSRFLFVRGEKKKQTKGPLQLDLFEPVEFDQEYKVVVTNKRGRAGGVVSFHEGRGYQEKILGEGKSQAQMGYIPCRRRAANETYMLCTVMAHNLGRELQMRAAPRSRGTTAKRTVLWVFEGLATLRGKIIQRAARVTHPQGRKTLTFGKNSELEAALERFGVA